MRTVTIKINYHTSWGEYLSIVLKNTKEEEIIYCMEYDNESNWKLNLDIPNNVDILSIKFILKQGEEIKREEYGDPHVLKLPNGDCTIQCQWQEPPKQKYFSSSFFYNSIFKHKYRKQPKLSYEILFTVDCLHVQHDQELVMCGAGEFLGNWDIKLALPLTPVSFQKWVINLPLHISKTLDEYKFAIRNNLTKKLIEWEDGPNRILSIDNQSNPTIIECSYRKSWVNWKASGVAIPMFSLRTEQSFGIGEFSDLEMLIDWAVKCRMKVIQVLPINDTTTTHTWIDSYPYRTISIYALNPIYLGLNDYPLENKDKYEEYIKIAQDLNKQSVVKYDEVLKLKTKYILDLFNEIGEQTINSKKFLCFLEKNEHWLFSYASFCYFRDKHNTTNFSEWGSFKTYNKPLIKELIESQEEINRTFNQIYFTQYLLHIQLIKTKEYAYKKGIILKGDIPIGIASNSVESWTEPHLFNLDCQTGAPPDDFSENGQNWGFPTYNWEEMKKDNFSWWRKRFEKMSDYFDAYRIDHILGFFRIWEIPKTSIHGLLGYFSPALPMTINEINSWGYTLEEKRDTIASIHKDDLNTLFGMFTNEVKNKYLHSTDELYYYLNETVNTEVKIRDQFLNKQEPKYKQIQDGLFKVCNEVLFIKDKFHLDKFHPRISLQHTLKFKRLIEEQKNILNRLYDYFFYQKHTNLWRGEALSKLPSLIKSTDMLVCGEDLGMVPASVESVMKELEILSLEIQRMPKQEGIQFSVLSQLPYLSVATTSTHDMSPIRMWWNENKNTTQNFYNNILNLKGTPPEDCNPDICLQIIDRHLASPAMLTILPLQDWLSISDEIRRKNPEEERINEPSNPNNNWNYRMHITLEDLVEKNYFNELLSSLNERNGR